MSLLALAAVGGLLALDGTSVGQFMVSRPLVAGTLVGWMLGVPTVGLAVGALLELYLLVQFPVGGARFPEGGPATVVAVVGAASGSGGGALALGVAVALVWGQLGGFSISALRILNERLAPDPTAGQLTPRRVVTGHLVPIALDFARGATVTATGVWVARTLVPVLEDHWPLATPDTRALLLLGGMVSLGILLRSYGGLRARAGLFGAGLATGLLVGWLL